MALINKWREVYDCPQSVDPFKNGVPKAPLYLDVELTNMCNLKCKFCVGANQMKREKGFMNSDNFLNICEQAGEMGVKGVRFLRWGEPFLNMGAVGFIRVAKSCGLLTHVTTNGTLLDSNLIDEIVSSGLDSIIISFQGTNEYEYEKLRGDHYETVKRNASNLVLSRDRHKSNFPYITVSTTVTDETEEMINNFKREFSFVDDVCVGSTWFKRLKNTSKVEDFISRARKLPHKFRCVEVMNKLSIDWDGSVSPCCLDYDRQLTIANINDSTLEEIWAMPELGAIRTLLSNKMQDVFSLCQTCECNYKFRGIE